LIYLVVIPADGDLNLMGIPIPMLFTNRFAQHMRHSEEPTKIKATPTNREYQISEPLRGGQWGNTGCFAMR
jgi:hypothetical protein